MELFPRIRLAEKLSDMVAESESAFDIFIAWLSFIVAMLLIPLTLVMVTPKLKVVVSLNPNASEETCPIDLAWLSPTEAVSASE